MKRTVKFTHPAEHTFDEKFIGIYMEVQKFEVEGGIPPASTIWHLEDEERPEYALCGKSLHSLCRLVSPALAMTGKPCPDCKAIVKAWLVPPSKAQRFSSRLGLMLRNDNAFRKNVRLIVDSTLFNKNFESLKQSAKTRAK